MAYVNVTLEIRGQPFPVSAGIKGQEQRNKEENILIIIPIWWFFSANSPHFLSILAHFLHSCTSSLHCNPLTFQLPSSFISTTPASYNLKAKHTQTYMKHTEHIYPLLFWPGWGNFQHRRPLLWTSFVFQIFFSISPKIKGQTSHFLLEIGTKCNIMSIMNCISSHVLFARP